MLNTDPMMLERFGDHLLQHLRTQKTHFSYLHRGTLKCWCSAVRTAPCQPISEKCLVAHVLYLHFKGNRWNVRCRGMISHRLTCYKRAGSWLEHILNTDICLLIGMLRLRWGDGEFVKSFVSMCLMRGSFTALSQITHYLYSWTGPAARSCTWVCTISLLA